MGYTTEFEGLIEISPPLNAEEIAFLKKFNKTRRMKRKSGPYFVDGTGFAGQDRSPDVIEYNDPPEGQPGLWCGWEPADDGSAIQWDGGEKFYHAAEWMKYLIEHFLKEGAIASPEIPFLQCNHELNGEIVAQGEDPGDRWDLIVNSNKVKVRKYSLKAGAEQEI